MPSSTEMEMESLVRVAPYGVAQTLIVWNRYFRIDLYSVRKG